MSEFADQFDIPEDDEKKDAKSSKEEDLLKELEEKQKEIIRLNKKKLPEPTPLTDEQKKRLLDRWNQPGDPPSLMECVEISYPGKGLNGRSPEAKLVKSYLATLNIRPKTAHDKESKTDLVRELTEEDKEYISNHAINSRPFEMARVLFNDIKITALHAESKVVEAYVKTLPSSVRFADVSELTQYRPPKSELEAINRVNSYTEGAINKSKLTPLIKRNIHALINHLHSFRFITQINSYENEMSRKLFESVFISNVWSKAEEFESEEIHQHITLAQEVVLDTGICKRIETLQKISDGAVDEKLNDSEAKLNITQNYVELIGKLNSEHDACIKRQNKLINDLAGKRSERVKDKHSQSTSLLTLLEFVRNYETRKSLQEQEKMRNEQLKNEVERLKTLDDLIVQIWGVAPEDVV